MENRTKEEKKAAAARTLSDELGQIDWELERAKLLAGDLVQDYFGCFNPSSSDDVVSICFGYKRFGIFADIVFDYLCEMEEHIKALRELERAGTITA